MEKTGRSKPSCRCSYSILAVCRAAAGSLLQIWVQDLVCSCSGVIAIINLFPSV